MKFHLDHIPAKPGFEIDHSQSLFLMGSCFSENIGDILRAHKFPCLVNPGGIMFNPLSIHSYLTGVINEGKADENKILVNGTSFYSFDHHSSVNASSQIDLLDKINAGSRAARLFLRDASFLVITFGTAYHYFHTSLRSVVANCHKQPSVNFEKKLLSVDEIVKGYSDLIGQIKKLNPSLKIIFTVSPVKHLRDGLAENNLSKATLILAVHEIVKKFELCSYFPAYELVNDDLRDYRFYKEDLAHPNAQAIEYIWQKFSGTYFSERTLHLNAEIEKLNLALSHRITADGSTGKDVETQKLKDFIEKQKIQIKKLNPAIEV